MLRLNSRDSRADEFNKRHHHVHDVPCLPVPGSSEYTKHFFERIQDYLSLSGNSQHSRESPSIALLGFETLALNLNGPLTLKDMNHSKQPYAALMYICVVSARALRFAADGCMIYEAAEEAMAPRRLGLESLDAQRPDKPCTLSRPEPRRSFRYFCGSLCHNSNSSARLR